MAQKGQLKSSVWEYFERCDDLIKAKCLICHNIYNCSTSHNLKHHLRNMHSDVVEEFQISSTPRSNKITVPDRKTSELISKAFTKVEGDKLAMCNLCLRIFSFRSTTANLKVHLRRVHPDEYPNLLEGESDGDINISNQDEEDSDSNDELEGGQSKDQHGKKYPKFEIIDDDVYTEVVYLEEVNQEKKKKKNSRLLSKQKQKLPGTEKSTVCAPFSRNEDTGRSSGNRSSSKSGNNELDQFGEYVATLLAGLPKHVCTKLQMNILKQIMDEKLSIESANEKSEIKVRSNEETDDNNQLITVAQEPNKKRYKYTITDNVNIIQNE